MKTLIDASQALGRALMLPIAVLPIAGLLLRLGQPDVLDMPRCRRPAGRHVRGGVGGKVHPVAFHRVTETHTDVY